MTSNFFKTRGGARPGAGRKKGGGPMGAPTIPMRVPVQYAALLKQWCLDMGNAEHLDKAYFPPIKPNLKPCPLYGSKVAAGFPSPADDYLDQALDLNEYLIRNQASTFFLTVEGNSMVGAGIFDGDLLIVDRSVKPINDKIIIAVLNGETTVKRLKFDNGTVWLMPENPDYKALEISFEMDFKIWGVVTNVIHKL